MADAAIIIPALLVSGVLEGEMRSPTPDENLFKALVLSTFIGGAMFVFWALGSDSKVARIFCRMVDKVNDILTFGKGK